MTCQLIDWKWFLWINFQNINCNGNDWDILIRALYSKLFHSSELYVIHILILEFQIAREFCSEFFKISITSNTKRPQNIKMFFRTLIYVPRTFCEPCGPRVNRTVLQKQLEWEKKVGPTQQIQEVISLAFKTISTQPKTMDINPIKQKYTYSQTHTTT